MLFTQFIPINKGTSEKLAMSFGIFGSVHLEKGRNWQKCEEDVYIEMRILKFPIML